MRTHLRAAATLFALILTTMPLALAQTTLLALSKHDHTLSVIDPTTLRTLYTLYHTREKVTATGDEGRHEWRVEERRSKGGGVG